MPFDISLLPDSEMRPWAETKETDEKVKQELVKVNLVSFSMCFLV